MKGELLLIIYFSHPPPPSIPKKEMRHQRDEDELVKGWRKNTWEVAKGR